MDRIERHDLINAVALAVVLMTFALLLILGARALFDTVNEGLIVSTEAPTDETGGTATGEQAGAPTGDASAEGEAAAPTGAEGQPSSTEAPTTTTTAAPRPPGEVTIRVGNGAQRAGVAAAGGDRLEALGYDVVDLANAPPRRTSVVWYASGYEAEAKAVAAALAIPADAVQAAPADADLDTSGVAVTVVLGADTSIA